MPKRVGNMFESIVSWDNLYSALMKAAKRKKGKPETCEWLFNREKYLFDLQEELLNQSYRPQPYRYFNIYEPKERVISVASFRDRVVHNSLINIIEPLFEKLFIYDSYATRRNKGLHRAVSRVQSYSRSSLWYLKSDIKKYFDSINHDILLSLIERKIKDDRVLQLCKVILQNQTESANLKGNCGLPIGNLTSQFFANVYLNPFDHYVKQELKHQKYVRYMDDFIIMHQDKQVLLRSLQFITDWLQSHLSLKLKENSVQINRVAIGIPFLGYRIFPNLIRLQATNLHRCVKNIHRTEKDFYNGFIDEKQLYQSTISRLGFHGFADSKRLKKRLWG